MRTPTDRITKPWGNPDTAKILVIGHDPRLQTSNTLATYCFFADYYFNTKPTEKKELAKYQLAEALFGCVRDLTNGRISDEEVLITNLCNQALPSPSGGRTVFIPRERAEKGLEDIRDLLAGSHVKVVFSMSQQVNYWLQVLGFYSENASFVNEAKPKEIGINCIPPYYTPIKGRAFKRICGLKFVADSQYYLFPILHIKNYPLKGQFCLYEEDYTCCRMRVKEVINSL